MRASSKRPRVEPYGVTTLPPFSTGDTTAEEPVDHATNAAAADVPPPPTSEDSKIRRMLETVVTIQAAHGQILVNMLDEIHALRTELAQF